MLKNNNLVIYSFFGPPGAGKGTLAQRCKKELGFEVLSTGDLCRKHVARKTQWGMQLEEKMKSGALISDDLIFEMVKDYLLKYSGMTPLILDGFPRTASQGTLLFSFFEKFKTDFRVIFFDIPHEELVRRLSNRLVCSNQECQSIYSLVNLLPRKEGICDKCDSALNKRDDDSLEIIKERLAHYPRYEKELMNFYKSVKQPIEVLSINAQSALKVFQSFEGIFDQPTPARLTFDVR